MEIYAANEDHIIIALLVVERINDGAIKKKLSR